MSPALVVGPMGGDYMQMARVDPRLQVPGFAYAPLDLFRFVSGDPAQRAVLRRPLSSLTHLVDQWPWVPPAVGETLTLAPVEPCGARASRPR